MSVLKIYELASKKLKNKFSMCCRVLGHKIFSRMFSFSEILVNFDKNGKKICKKYTVCTQCTNCISEISPPIPPHTNWIPPPDMSLIVLAVLFFFHILSIFSIIIILNFPKIAPLFKSQAFQMVYPWFSLCQYTPLTSL